ncbi:MAG: lactoylglutathione lyase [Alphaproteobacteria bacterium]|jgi:lactoylglutathione lyase|nr:lactoylglutathione lyase [Alphaproteobacteria bacterium]
MDFSFLHTMIRVNNLEESLTFYRDLLGMNVIKNTEYPDGKFTLVFLGYGEDKNTPMIELTYNWDTHSYDLGNAFGHIALGVSDIYATCNTLKEKGVKITREPGQMKFGGSVIAFIEDPNGYKIELIQKKSDV